MREGWEDTTLGEIAHIKQGTTLAVKDMTGGDHPVYGANGIVGWYHKGNSGERVVALGCRGSCGTIHMAEPGAWLANNVMAVVPRTDQVLVDFLALLLESADFMGSGVISGQVQPQITRTSLSPLRLPLPPLAEQRRIVDLIGAVDDYVAKSEKELEVGIGARAAVLAEQLGQGGDDWVETTLGGVAEWFSGGTPKAGTPEFYDGDIPWAVIADLREPHLVTTASTISKAGLGVIGGRLAPEGAVLVSMYGTIARVAVAMVPMATNQAIAWGVVDEDVSTSQFVRLEVEHMQPTLDGLARGATQRNINRAILKEQKLLLPPLAEQQRIVTLISSIDESNEALWREVASARGARAAMLAELLDGSREIPGDYDSLLEMAS